MRETLPRDCLWAVPCGHSSGADRSAAANIDPPYSMLSEAIRLGETVVEGVHAPPSRYCSRSGSTNRTGYHCCAGDPAASCVQELHPDALVDAILAKKNLGTRTSRTRRSSLRSVRALRPAWTVTRRLRPCAAYTRTGAVYGFAAAEYGRSRCDRRPRGRAFCVPRQTCSSRAVRSRSGRDGRHHRVRCGNP